VRAASVPKVAGKGIQAVLLERWQPDSVMRLAVTLAAYNGGPAAIEVCPFQGKGNSELENITAIARSVAAVRPLIFIFHLGFQRDDPGFDSQFSSRADTVRRQFVDQMIGEGLGPNLTIKLSPKLEDEWDEPPTAKGYFDTLSEKFAGTPVTFVRSSTL